MDTLQQILVNNGIKPANIITCDSITEALIKAKQICHNEDRIVAFGSFLVIEHIYRNLG